MDHLRQFGIDKEAANEHAYIRLVGYAQQVVAAHNTQSTDGGKESFVDRLGVDRRLGLNSLAQHCRQSA